MKEILSTSVPNLVSLCLVQLAKEPPQLFLKSFLRRLPEELVMDLLNQMIDQNTITDERLVLFLIFSRRVLQLKGCCRIRNSILRQFPFRCPNLISLDLSNCFQVNNTIVSAVLRGCGSLRLFKLDGCRHITDAGFQPDPRKSPLLACRTLETLSFARCSQLTKELVFFLLKACGSLKNVNFSRCKRISSDAIQMVLSSFKYLQKLNLSFMENTITDETFLTIQCRSLKEIDLTQSRITDTTLFQVSMNCHRVEKVKLSSCNEITDAGIEALVSRCMKIQELDLNNCGLLTDRGVMSIAKYTRGHLRRLNLSWCMNITDKSIFEVALNCSFLEELGLVWCTQLTNSSVKSLLTNAITLRKIHVSGCKQMKMDILKEQIAQRRPHLEVLLLPSGHV
jgi:F-box/leucine-rich repeat protein 2/20